jgi:hypothetical protein
MTMIALLLLAAAPLPAPPNTPMAIAFDAASIMGLPRGEASLTAHGETIRCEGAWLSDLVAKAGLPVGPGVRGPALAAGVVAAGADGYRVLFGAAELEPGIGTTRVLVADRCTGASAGDGGVPRLVVPGDGRAARSVRNLQALTYLPDATGAIAPP